MNRASTWASWATIAALAFGAAVGYGALSNRVQNSEAAIAQMQADKRATEATLNQINERTARMEAKLEFLLPTSAIKLAEVRR